MRSEQAEMATAREREIIAEEVTEPVIEKD